LPPVPAKYAFVLEASEHAELSASSAERWMSCPGSAALSAGVPNHSSKFAAEGTAAHFIAAFHQHEILKGEHVRLTRWRGQTALVEGHEIELTEDLLEAVGEFLLDCQNDKEDGDVVFIEQSLTPALKKLHPKFGGSADRVRWRPRTRHLRVTDYKHGAGVPVDVDDNKQLKKYALGVLLTNQQFNADEVEIRIAQPRCDHEQGRFRSYTFKAIELIDFAADLVDAAKRTEEFGADLVPSKKACKWCPANAADKCPAIKQETHAIVAASFDMLDPQKYSLEQIAEFLAKAPLVEARISALREFAYNRACAGEKIPGFKLVDKRATRKWKDGENVAQRMASMPGAFTVPEIRSPAQLEKLLGKKKFEKVLGDQVEKQSSGHTLVPDSDNRPPVAVAQLEDFGTIED
jgi:hypothetical protein